MPKTKNKANGRLTPSEIKSMSATQIIRRLSVDELADTFTSAELFALIARYEVEKEERLKKSKRRKTDGTAKIPH
jgi:hypothetical protein